MKTINVVAGVLHYREKYYIFKRPEDKFFGGLWEFPGGKIEKGETEVEAVAREIEEELELIVTPGKLIVKTTYTIDVIINISFYDIELDGPITDPVLNDHSEMKVVTKDTIAGVDWAGPDIEALDTIFG